MAEWMRNELIDEIYEEYLDVKNDLIKASEDEEDVSHWKAFSFRDYLRVLADDAYLQLVIAADKGLSVCLKGGCNKPVMGGTIHAFCEEHYDEWSSAYFKP